jgi:ribosomal protein L37AE/L43A
MTGDADPKKAEPRTAVNGQAQYTPAELKQIREEFVSGKTPACPQCQVAMTKREIGGGSFGLGYARQRDWLICPKCRRSAIFDIHRGTRT